MGKKTKNEKKELQTNIELRSLLMEDVASRNPLIRSHLEKYPTSIAGDPLRNRSLDKDYGKLCEEVYGSDWPIMRTPVSRVGDFTDNLPYPSNVFVQNPVVLKIDLTYSLDEIMYYLELHVKRAFEIYRKRHTIRRKRKNPSKWVDYLTVWDLKREEPVTCPHFLYQFLS